MSKLKELIGQALEERRTYRELDKKAKLHKEVFDDLKMQIIKICEELGIDATSIDGLANIRVSEKTHASVKDWDALIAWMKENDAFYLFQKRIASSAYNELLEQGEDIPGIEPFKQADVTIRELN
ncbi:hypothetical protein [Alteromonas mediterranea]|uniref:Uncharacterized protein n=1 Tax=Alteromonas mediterranea (strain DSM 17117 / CIP 110805 / LMG 28347 / Deep ecotype) TaxID=1774373 RepID=T2DL45_ALTMD|nr:hypothetical protein [Alteromonas mediterranea]AGV54081.1 hypothetical protein MADE_000001022560 [Alteromonas mediterranea DE]